MSPTAGTRLGPYEIVAPLGAGGWLAYLSDESGRYEVYVHPFPTGGAVNQISADGGDNVAWSEDGRELYYESPGKKLMAATIETTPALSASVPRMLFQIPSGLTALEFHGQQGLALKPVGGGNPVTITLVLNWAAGLGSH